MCLEPKNMIMRHFFLLMIAGVLLTSCGEAENQTEWISLFDGESLDGWRDNAENPGTFRVVDGMIVVDGDRSHLFYDGPVSNHDFTNFEFKADIMTRPGSNSGIFFHTAYQEEGWPSQGYEAQVNNSAEYEPRKTASVYSFDDNMETTFPDDEWFTMTIRVEGKQVQISVNDSLITDYIEPEDMEGSRKLSSGTFALQGHDPNSIIYYKNIRVREL